MFFKKKNLETFIISCPYSDTGSVIFMQSHYVALAGLTETCLLCLPNTGSKGECHHLWPSVT